MWILIERNYTLLNINTGARFRVALAEFRSERYDASVIYEGPAFGATEDSYLQTTETLYQGTEEECQQYIVKVLQPEIPQVFLPSVNGTSRKEAVAMVREFTPEFFEELGVRPASKETDIHF